MKRIKFNLLKLLFLIMASVIFTSCILIQKLKQNDEISESHHLPSRSPAELSSSCLPTSLFPPSELPTNLKYAGFYTNTLANPIAKSIEQFSTSLDELEGQGNVINIAYLPQNVLDPLIDPDQLLIYKLQKAQEKGFKVIMELGYLFFNEDPKTGKFNVALLRSDYADLWKKFKNLIAPYSSLIVAFYPFDEPYWSAYSTKVPYETMTMHLDTIAKVAKKDFPSIALLFIDGFPVINENLPIPQNWDWIGMDCYGSFTNCGWPGQEKSIPSYYSILKSKMAPHQKLVIIPDAFLFSHNPTTDEQINVVKTAKQFLTWAQSEPNIIGIFPFLYRNIVDENATGAYEMCPVKEFYRQYLTTAKRSFDSFPPQPPVPFPFRLNPLTITCPKVITAGDDGTCVATSLVPLSTGIWTVNGYRVTDSQDKFSYTWVNPAVGTHMIQAVAKDLNDQTILSNTIYAEVRMPPIYCPVPEGYTAIHCSKTRAPYTPGTICEYSGPSGPGTAICGNDGTWAH